MIRLFLIPLLFLLSFEVPAAEPVEAKKLVESVSNQILDEIASDKEKYNASKAELYGLVKEVILPHFDFYRMSRMVLVRQWKKMSDDQKGRFEEEFRQLLVRIYSRALLEYQDETIDYLPLRVSKDKKRVIVKTEVIQSGGGRLSMDYHLYLKDECWKVFDVRVEGISLLKSYQDGLGRQAKVDGVDAVIESLVKKNRESAE